MKKTKAHDFVWRTKKEETEAIKALPCLDWKDFKNLDDPKYNWVQVGEDKYGRHMYCTNTHAKRSQTMGEFYGGGIVD